MSDKSDDDEVIPVYRPGGPTMRGSVISNISIDTTGKIMLGDYTPTPEEQWVQHLVHIVFKY